MRNNKYFTVFFLQVCEDLYQQIIMMQQQEEKENLSIDEVFTFIPGVSFTRLLHTLSEPVLDGNMLSWHGSCENVVSSVCGFESTNVCVHPCVHV